MYEKRPEIDQGFKSETTETENSHRKVKSKALDPGSRYQATDRRLPGVSIYLDPNWRQSLGQQPGRTCFCARKIKAESSPRLEVEP